MCTENIRRVVIVPQLNRILFRLMYFVFIDPITNATDTYPHPYNKGKKRDEDAMVNGEGAMKYVRVYYLTRRMNESMIIIISTRFSVAVPMLARIFAQFRVIYSLFIVRHKKSHWQQSSHFTCAPIVCRKINSATEPASRRNNTDSRDI